MTTSEPLGCRTIGEKTVLSIEEVKNMVSEAQLDERYTLSVLPEAHGACCVEVRDALYGNLCWRKRSYEPDFVNAFKHYIERH